MTDTTALVPIEERTILFEQDALLAVLVEDGGERQVYVPIRPICEYLGLAWHGQYERMKRDDYLATVIRSVRVTRTERGERDMICLPLEVLPGFLFTISVGRVKPELQAKVRLYRERCFRVLWDAFKFDLLLPTDTPAPVPHSGASWAYELATAVQHLAQEQMGLESRMNQAAQWARTIDARVTALEVRSSGGKTISEAEAAELALHVKTVAQAMEGAGHTNSYQRVYAELYRRYAVASYRSLPHAKFAEALQWLRDWYQEIAPSPRTDQTET